MVVRRSLLMMPANIARFVEKAHTYAADAIMLDLEDAVSRENKASARAGVKSAVEKAAQSGHQVFVRVNNDREILEQDIAAAVSEKLYGIVLPKAESLETLDVVDRSLLAQEQKCGLRPGKIKLSLLIETARGVINLEQLAGANRRIDSILFGSEDFCSELGVWHSPDGSALLYALSKIVLCCKANDLLPIGLLGSVAEFRDLSKFRRAAEGAMWLGCEGGLCIHPQQIEILNQVFSPKPEERLEAQRIAQAYEDRIQKGIGAVSLEGKMIDAPVYKKALRTLAKGGCPEAKNKLEEEFK